MSELNAVFITQARMGSSRLPGKVMRRIAGEPLLFWFLKRAMEVRCCSRVCVATGASVENDEIDFFVGRRFPEVHVTRGSEDDVLARYWKAVCETDADVVVRVTSDDPFFDPLLVARCVAVLKERGADAARTRRADFPVGLDVEVFKRETLRIAFEKATDALEREHVGPYVFQTHSADFKIEWVGNDGVEWPRCRLTVDYPEDFEFVEKVFSEVGALASSDEYRDYLSSHPEIVVINAMHAH